MLARWVTAVTLALSLVMLTAAEDEADGQKFKENIFISKRYAEKVTAVTRARFWLPLQAESSGGMDAKL